MAVSTLQCLASYRKPAKPPISTRFVVVTADFARAAKTVSGLELGEDIVNFIFLMFDEDGDGELSHHEFVKVMKDARSRGLNKEKELPVKNIKRGFSALVTCIKQQIMIGNREEKEKQRA
eukprot:TRINITY_DN7597_c0_g1_i4.p1 TRINITY_DN7597_c0_g1~~TRINITY_DN7597_c0_g1_i4.p1  ORF type:complete len:120 (+),score=39.43 TRINITY_DN7597_c0_g1_i4:80-439(+)